MKTGNYNTTQDLDKPLFVYVVYYNVRGKSSAKAHEEIQKLYHLLNGPEGTRPRDYVEKYHIIPVQDQETKVELLYPVPEITDESALKRIEKGYEIISERLDKLGEYRNYVEKENLDSE